MTLPGRAIETAIRTLLAESDGAEDDDNDEEDEFPVHYAYLSSHHSQLLVNSPPQ